MAIAGEYDFVPAMPLYDGPSTLSVGIFQWVYTKDGKNLKKSKAVYRVKGPAYRWQEIKERARQICDSFNAGCFGEILGKKSETI